MMMKMVKIVKIIIEIMKIIKIAFQSLSTHVENTFKPRSNVHNRNSNQKIVIYRDQNQFV